VVAASAGLFGAFGGCGGSASPYEDVEAWHCFEDEASCGCRGTASGVTVEDPRPAVVTCSAALSCCFVKKAADGTFDCTCVAVEETGGGGEGGGAGAAGDPALDCVSAAVEHGTSEVVVRCPPVELDNSSVCAVLGESCEPDYLNRLGLIACCNGTTCRPGSGGDVCQ